MLAPLVIAGYTRGGQLMLTSDVENFPGYEHSVAGPELIGDLTAQAQRFGAEFWGVDVQTLDLSKHPFVITTRNATLSARAIILATGADAVWLDAQDEEQFRGRGISTCATCDGALFKGKDVVVVGGGDSAMEEATFLTRFARKVTLVHRGATFRASKTMLQRALQHKRIEVKAPRIVRRWLGDKRGLLRGVELQNPDTSECEEVACSGGFIAIGHRPNTRFLGGQVRASV
jgi:thioredoxin reductase (NADPH)